MFATFKQWWSKPFDSQQSAINWVLTVGLILIAVAMWGRIIRMFEAVGEAV